MNIEAAQSVHGLGEYKLCYARPGPVGVSRVRAADCVTTPGHTMVIGDNNAVTADEANILADFFNLQADKHGPELLKRLNNITETEERDKGPVPGSRATEQRKHKIQIEVEAENVVRHEVKLEQGRQPGAGAGADQRPVTHHSRVLHSDNNSGPGHNHALSFLLAKSQAESVQTEPAVQYLMSHDGKIFPLLPETLLKSLPLLKGPGAVNKDRQDRVGVSVIQRAPAKPGQTMAMSVDNCGGGGAKIELNNPNIILERRVHLEAGEAGAGDGHRRRIDTSSSGSPGASQTATLSLVTSNSARPSTDLLSSLAALASAGLVSAGSEAAAVKGKKSNQQQSDHLICEVCGERAGKHSYYGGQVCPSCRAFFRRSVQSRYNETFKCTKGREDCHINLMTRKNCQFCRYQKCLGAGMRPSWILSDEERVRRFHGRTLQGRTEKGTTGRGRKPKQEKTSPKSSSKGSDTEEPMSLDEDLPSSVEARSSPDSVASLSLQPVTEDKVDLRGLGQLFRKVCTGRHDDLDPSLLTDLLQVTLHCTSLSVVTASQLSEVMDSRSRACLQLLPEFRALSPRDQAAILAHNLPLIHRFRQALCLHTLSWSDLIRELIGEDKIKQEEENLPTDLSGSPKKTLAYRDLFSFPWCQSEEVETIHKTMMEDIASWVDIKDEVQLILLALILAFNHDFLDLEGRGQVEKIQLKYVILLQTHLRTKYPTNLAASKLTKAVMLPAVTREILQITKKRLNI